MAEERQMPSAEPTDVSTFREAYKKKTPVKANFSQEVEVIFRDFDEKGKPIERRRLYLPVKYQLRYGTNPHQPFMAYFPVGLPLSVGALEMLKGGKDGLSLTNLQDMSQALGSLRYFPCPATIAMKHLNPCGFEEGSPNEESVADAALQKKGETQAELYELTRKCDERSHFGSVVGFNRRVEPQTAERIMGSFVECVIAPEYAPEALEILKSTEGTKKLNNGIRVVRVQNMDVVPKFIGDDVSDYLNTRNLIDGTLTFEIPYLTRIRTIDDFVLRPMIPNSDPARNGGKDYVVQTLPTTEQLGDCLTAWYLNINVRSNGIVFVRDGRALAIGTGQQERIGAVEQAIAKAKQKGHSLEGAVMSSDAFFPSRDCIDAVAAEGVRAVVWPAGSMADNIVIEAANEHNIALVATLERCFAHF